MPVRPLTLALTLSLAPLALADEGTPAKPDVKRKDEGKKDDKKPDAPKGDKKPDAPKGDKKPDAPKGDKKPDPKKDKKDKKDKKPERKIDTTSEDAQALAELLAVPPRFAADRRVELRYDFKKPEQLDDWRASGFDRVARNNGVLLASGSRGRGFFVHELAMQGNFELVVRCRIVWTMTSSELVFLLGSGKSGAIFATGFAKSSRRGYRLVSRRQRVDKSVFRGGRTVTVKLVVKDGVDVSAWVEGKKVTATQKLKNRLDGRVGFYVNNMRFRIEWVEIRGEVDLQKLRRRK